jgi:hypothetical protein
MRKLAFGAASAAIASMFAASAPAKAAEVIVAGQAPYVAAYYRYPYYGSALSTRLRGPWLRGRRSALLAQRTSPLRWSRRLSPRLHLRRLRAVTVLCPRGTCCRPQFFFSRHSTFDMR